MAVQSATPKKDEVPDRLMKIFEGLSIDPTQIKAVEAVELPSSRKIYKFGKAYPAACEIETKFKLYRLPCNDLAGAVKMCNMLVARANLRHVELIARIRKSHEDKPMPGDANYKHREDAEALFSIHRRDDE